VYSLCMGVGVCTALLVFTQLSSVTEGFKLCWRTGQKLTLKPSVLAVMCLRGSRSSLHHPISFFHGEVDLAIAEGQGSF